mmetsp:Transcript_4589/g.11825  ORF Transcript_4589/g.11825 Transcript_4589/m.11825 type:complete len:210 (+) Transcript_4589:190-819(+)
MSVHLRLLPVLRRAHEHTCSLSHRRTAECFQPVEGLFADLHHAARARSQAYGCGLLALDMQSHRWLAADPDTVTPPSVPVLDLLLDWGQPDAWHLPPPFPLTAQASTPRHCRRGIFWCPHRTLDRPQPRPTPIRYFGAGSPSAAARHPRLPHHRHLRSQQDQPSSLRSALDALHAPLGFVSAGRSSLGSLGRPRRSPARSQRPRSPGTR